MNGLSVGSGGGYSVARGITRHVAMLRPDWRITLLLTADHPLHERMRDESMPDNVSLHFAPATTRTLVRRTWYEWFALPGWVREHGVTAVVQLNGIVVPTLRVPTLAHFQDPWPFRSQAWEGTRDRLLAALKRHAIARSTYRAAWCGFTSGYLRDVICRGNKICSERSSVFLNGLPRAFADRLNEPTVSWTHRPMEILTVSDVADYKRQWLVIRALPLLRQRKGLESLVYRIIGRCDVKERAKLLDLAAMLGVSDAVRIEGVVSDVDLHAAFRSARAFVMMSVCESFGLPAIEAMSLGAPVLTSACCAMPEICGDAAELVPVDNIDALAERLGDLLLDPARAEMLRERGRRRVLRFSWLATADHIARTLQFICPSSIARTSRIAAEARTSGKLYQCLAMLTALVLGNL